jgi:hypothetical protein
MITSLIASKWWENQVSSTQKKSESHEPQAQGISDCQLFIMHKMPLYLLCFYKEFMIINGISVRNF